MPGVNNEKILHISIQKFYNVYLYDAVQVKSGVKKAYISTQAI